MNKSWIVGYFEGEGCFFLSIQKTKNGTLQFNPRISLSSVDLSSIEKIIDFIGFGDIVKTSKKCWIKTAPNARDQYMFRLYSFNGVKKFLKLFPLRLFQTNNKKRQVTLFKEGFKLIESGECFTYDGALKIASLRDKMGRPSKPKNYVNYNMVKNFLDTHSDKYDEYGVYIRKSKRFSGYSTLGKKKRRKVN